ncbi:MAG: hypothetical protein J4F31_10270 [Flavobacteriales bacterium]|nr:hypothetical protein [Flavobacteriales bacterium]
MKKILMALAIAGSLVSCNNNKAQVEELEQEVLQLHDDVMAKMSDLAKYEDALAKRVADTTALLDSVARIEMDSTRARVLRAHQGMLNWMRDYNPPSVDESAEAAKAYLEEQKNKMQKLKELTNKSLDEAAAILNE